MSWNTNAILIHSDYSKDYSGLLLELGLKGKKQRGLMSFEDASASSFDDVAIGTTDGWTALWGNVALWGVDGDGLLKISKRADIFSMNLAGVSGTFGFSWYSGGRMVREWMIQDGEVFRNEGDPLPAEMKAFAKYKDDEEQAVLRILFAMTLPFKKLESIEYQPFAISE